MFSSHLQGFLKNKPPAVEGLNGPNVGMVYYEPDEGMGFRLPCREFPSPRHVRVPVGREIPVQIQAPRRLVHRDGLTFVVLYVPFRVDPVERPFRVSWLPGNHEPWIPGGSFPFPFVVIPDPHFEDHAVAVHVGAVKPGKVLYAVIGPHLYAASEHMGGGKVKLRPVRVDPREHVESDPFQQAGDSVIYAEVPEEVVDEVQGRHTRGDFACVYVCVNVYGGFLMGCLRGAACGYGKQPDVPSLVAFSDGTQAA